MTNNVLVDRNVYEELMDDSLFLSCLQTCGVENWDGFDGAVEMYLEATEDLDEEDGDVL